MMWFVQINKWLRKKLEIGTLNHYSLLGKHLSIEFVLILIVTCLVVLPVFYFLKLYSYLYLAIPVFLLFIASTIIALKIKSIKFLTYALVITQFLMVNIGLILSGLKVNEITILWSLALVFFTFLAINKTSGMVVMLVQFFIICTCVEITHFLGPSKFIHILDFKTNTITISLPVFLVTYYIIRFYNADKSLRNDLYNTNKNLQNLHEEALRQNQLLLATQTLLSDSEKQFRLIAEHSNDLIIIFQPDFQFRYISPSVKKMLGYDPIHLENKNLKDIIYIPYEKTLLKDLEKIFIPGSESIHIQTRLKKATGGFIWTESIFQPILENQSKIKHYLCISRDISIFKKQEESIKLFKNLISEATEAILITDSLGNIVFANKEISHLYGMSVNEMLSLNIQDIDDVLNDENKWERFIAEILVKKHIVSELSFLNAEGNCIPLERKVQYHEHEENGYLIFFMRNISDRKSQEIKIKRKIEQQQTLSEVAFILNTSQDFEFKIREAIRLIGNFVQIDRISIFEDILNGKAVSNTYEWCNNYVDKQKNNLQAIPYALFPKWKETFSNNKHIEIKDLFEFPQDILIAFQPLSLSSLLAFPIIVDNDISGFVYFSTSGKTKVWRKSEKEFLTTFMQMLSNTFDQKHRIDALKKSEYRFREFAELLPEMVFETNINGKILFVNKMAQERIGLTKDEIKNGLILFNLIAEKDRNIALSNFEKKIKGNIIKNEEYAIITKDGSEIPVHVYGNLIMRDNNPSGMRAIMNDISERKAAEKQLISIAKFYEESPYPILRIEKNGTISYCNIKGTQLKEFIEAHYTGYFSSIVELALEKDTVEEFELEVYEHFYSLTFTPVKEFQYLNVYGRDITQKKKDEEKLRISEQRFRDVTDAAGEFVWETDINFNITYISERVKQVLGYSRQELINSSLYHFIPHDSKEHVEKIIKEHVQKGESFKDIEYKANTKSNSLIWLSTTGIPIFDEVRHIIGFRGTSMDITQRKSYEDELNKSKQQAEKASAIKAEFLSTMSHEIRTPMNAVIGLTHLLLLENPLPSQIDTLKTLKFSAENLLVLLNDILDFTKIEAGKITFEEIDFNLSDLIGSIKNSFLPKAEEKEISIRINIGNNIPKYIMGDPARLAQVLNNLVSNAVKFTDAGNVDIKVLLIAQHKSEVDLKFEVADTGIGIAKDQLIRIFDSFTQASSDITRKYGGTGLGLAISKRLVEMQGGKLDVNSELGKGSIFHFYLRFKMGNPENILKEGSLFSGQYESFKGVKVLIVEDNQINQLVAKKFLEKWDIEFKIAENGEKALQIIIQEDFDVILMDIQMPVMDGYEASKRIRALPEEKYKKLPIIALTASVLLEIQNKIMAAGMNDFLIKPFNPDELYSKIKKYIKLNK